MAGDGDEEFTVLQSKRQATRYQILLEIAERQPSVSQQEIAEAIGVTSQAVSDYLQDLVAEGYVLKHGRGRYEVTTEGIDWLITQTDSLHELVTHVRENVIEQVDVETAIAVTDIEEGETVTLSMEDGLLRAMSGGTGSTTGVAVTSASADEDVGVTNFEGLLEYELGTVTIISVPSIRDGGSRAVDREAIEANSADQDLVAVDGVEASVAAQSAGLTPDVRFGSTDAIREAATRGLAVLAIVTADRVSGHTEALREHPIDYEVVDPSIH